MDVRNEYLRSDRAILTVVRKTSELAQVTEPEELTAFDKEYWYDPLVHYLDCTYRRIALEGKFTFSHDRPPYAAFNTGLTTPEHKRIYGVFSKTINDSPQNCAIFLGWYDCTNRVLQFFPSLPNSVCFYDDPARLVFDKRLDIQVEANHVFESDFTIPKHLCDMSDSVFLRNMIRASKSAIDQARVDYHMAIPQYSNGDIQFLLPLCFEEPTRADLALVIEKRNSTYYATRCLSMMNAYNNSRLLGKPAREWLRPY